MNKLRMESPDLTAQNIDRTCRPVPQLHHRSAGRTRRDPSAPSTLSCSNRCSRRTWWTATRHYEFTWVGKKAAIVEANKPIRKTLRPCVAESKDWDTTENLYIEGDNLEVLKLLQESYLGKVKMIYIDPPYNTGNDFIYADDFMRSQEEENEQMGMYDEDENRLFKNTDTNGRFHSDWCSMIYSRLLLARNLLTDDGVIFISIDDNEAKDLMSICDEIFGHSNFLATFAWQKKYGPANDAKGVSATHEYILLYGKVSNLWVPGLLPRSDEQLKAYKNPDNDPRGIWRASDLSARTYSASCDYIITGPTGLKFSPPPSRSWIVNEESYQRMLADNRITFGADGTGRPMQKKFITEVKDGITPETWLSREKGGDNKIARYELKEIFPENLFDTPKPSKLIKYLETIAGTRNTDIVLDFFSGSATTAHAVMQLNAEDGGHRKFIMVQLPEKCDEASEAYKAGYKNICEIGKERIRRAGDKIKSESPMTTQDLDIGFRILKLDDTNMKDVYYAPDDYDQGMLAGLESNIKEDRSDLDLLFGCLLDWGLPLSLPYTSEQIEGCTVHTYNDGDLIACFDANVPESVVKKIAQRKPLRAVFRDSGFASSPEKINVFEIFKFYMPEDADDIGKRVKVI
ncbi:MAG: site-specific DNA-methyltransferase [Evtepia sp.]